MKRYTIRPANLKAASIRVPRRGSIVIESVPPIDPNPVRDDITATVCAQQFGLRQFKPRRAMPSLTGFGRLLVPQPIKIFPLTGNRLRLIVDADQLV